MKDGYIEFKGPNLRGESRDKDHEGQIEIESYSHSITQPKSATASTAGGHTTERAQHGDLFFIKAMDISSPALMQRCH